MLINVKTKKPHRSRALLITMKTTLFKDAYRRIVKNWEFIWGRLPAEGNNVLLNIILVSLGGFCDATNRLLNYTNFVFFVVEPSQFVLADRVQSFVEAVVAAIYVGIHHA